MTDYKAQYHKLRSKVAGELEYLRNKARHLYNGMSVCIGVYDEDKPGNRFSLSTFAPVVDELAEELDELRSELWKG